MGMVFGICLLIEGKGRIICVPPLYLFPFFCCHLFLLLDFGFRLGVSWPVVERRRGNTPHLYLGALSVHVGHALLSTLYGLWSALGHTRGYGWRFGDVAKMEEARSGHGRLRVGSRSGMAMRRIRRNGREFTYRLVFLSVRSVVDLSRFSCKTRRCRRGAVDCDCHVPLLDIIVPLPLHTALRMPANVPGDENKREHL